MAQVDKTPKIVVDIDGVLFDTPQQAVDRWNELHDTTHGVTDIYDHDAVHNKVLFRIYHEDGTYHDENGAFDDGFYDAQKHVDGYRVMSGAIEALEHFRKMGAVIVALTSRDPRKLRDETVAAIDKHFGIGHDNGGLIDEVLFAGDPDVAGGHRKKSEIINAIGGHVLVDDAVRYVLDADQAGIPAILFSRPYNQSGHDWPIEKTANDWPKVQQMVDKLLKDAA